MSKKSPFVGYSTKEVMEFEATTYVIQVGSDVFNIKGKWVFTKKAAQLYYGKVLRELLNQLKTGNSRQRVSAKRALGTLKVMPLRLH